MYTLYTNLSFYITFTMINAFILCDLFENCRTILQQTEKEALNIVDVGNGLVKSTFFMTNPKYLKIISLFNKIYMYNIEPRPKTYLSQLKRQPLFFSQK